MDTETLVMLKAIALVLAHAAPMQAQSPAALQTQVNRLVAAQRKMDSTIARLELRIAKLEANADTDPKGVGESAEKQKADKELASMERRISALEHANPSGRGNTGASAARAVRAPFVVEDDDGSVILRVTGGKSPRLVIGEEKGGQVELGTGSAGGGVVRVRDATNTDRALIIASDGTGQFRAVARSHSATLTAADDENGSMLSLFSGDTPSARMRSGVQGYGALILTDPSANPLVFAGSMSSGGGYVGTVRAGPRARAGTMGPPSTLQGAP
jgi:hypothetical protein